jgi:hypothetical protein
VAGRIVAGSSREVIDLGRADMVCGVRVVDAGGASLVLNVVELQLQGMTKPRSFAMRSGSTTHQSSPIPPVPAHLASLSTSLARTRRR